MLRAQPPRQPRARCPWIPAEPGDATAAANGCAVVTDTVRESAGVERPSARCADPA